MSCDHVITSFYNQDSRLYCTRFSTLNISCTKGTIITKPFAFCGLLLYNSQFHEIVFPARIPRRQYEALSRDPYCGQPNIHEVLGCG